MHGIGQQIYIGGGGIKSSNFRRLMEEEQERGITIRSRAPDVYALTNVGTTGHCDWGRKPNPHEDSIWAKTEEHPNERGMSDTRSYPTKVKRRTKRKASKKARKLNRK